MLKKIKMKYGVVWCSVGQCWVYLRLIIGLSSAEQAAKLVAKKGNSIKRPYVQHRRQLLNSYIPTFLHKKKS